MSVLPTVLVLQHEAVEPLGAIGDALCAAGVAARYVRVYDGEPVPGDLDGMDGLIVMGGPMGVSEQDRYPFLSDEIRLLQHTWREGLPILGVCLGSQLLAAALGAPVTPAPRPEIGWYDVFMTEAAAEDPLWTGMTSAWTGFHWHGDVHGLPPGATRLAHSGLTPCQAFRAGRHAYGFQFHLEVTRPIIEDWLATFAEEARDGTQDRAQILAGADRHLAAMRDIGVHVFGQWARLVTEACKTFPGLGT